MRMAKNNSEAIEQARNIIERQLGRMVGLVDDLLDLSRISWGQVPLRMERIELAAVIQSAVETSRPVIEAGGHKLTIDMPSGPILVNADEARLAQVFANLLNNAAKYIERNGHIRLTVERCGPKIVVGVKDHGVGIPAQMLTRVFDMFTQWIVRLSGRKEDWVSVSTSSSDWWSFTAVLSKPEVKARHGQRVCRDSASGAFTRAASKRSALGGIGWRHHATSYPGRGRQLRLGRQPGDDVGAHGQRRAGDSRWVRSPCVRARLSPRCDSAGNCNARA